MKKLLLTTTMLAATAPSFASEIPGEFDSYVTLVTEYSFRGVAQSDENPALQGGLDWSHDSGAYLGAWGSTVDFNDGDEASMELDIFGGYASDIQNVSFDIGGIYYAYPGADSALNYDFAEGYLTLGYDFDVLSIGGSFSYSPEYFGESGHAEYVALTVDVPLPVAEATLSGRLGRQYVEDNAAFGLPDYNDWEVGVQVPYEQFLFNVSYIDTSLSETDCVDGCEARVIGGVSASF